MLNENSKFPVGPKVGIKWNRVMRNKQICHCPIKFYRSYNKLKACLYIKYLHGTYPNLISNTNFHNLNWNGNIVMPKASCNTNMTFYTWIRWELRSFYTWIRWGLWSYYLYEVAYLSRSTWGQSNSFFESNDCLWPMRLGVIRRCWEHTRYLLRKPVCKTCFKP